MTVKVVVEVAEVAVEVAMILLVCGGTGNLDEQ